MQFVKRAKRYENDLAIFRRWRALDADVAIVEVQSKFERRTRYLAVRQLHNGNEHIVSRHRSLRAAFKKFEGR